MKKILIIAVSIAAILVVIWPETLKLASLFVSVLVAIINVISKDQSKILRRYAIIALSLLIISSFVYAFNGISKNLLVGLYLGCVVLGLPGAATLLRKS